MNTGERGIKKGKYPAEPVTGSNHKKTQAHKQHNQDRRYNIQKSQGKTSTTLQYPKTTRKKHAQPRARVTHNQHNEDRRYNIPLNLLLVATGCKVHCGRLGALWVARCIKGAWVFRDKKVAHVLQLHACR